MVDANVTAVDANVIKVVADVFGDFLYVNRT
jgi:hypothetical protein